MHTFIHFFLLILFVTTIPCEAELTLYDCLGKEHEKKILYQIPEHETAEDKIFINENELLVTEEGLFVASNDLCCQISVLHSSKEGIFFFPSSILGLYRRCQNGHPILCDPCNGCARLLCDYRCACHDYKLSLQR